jgi:diguanylate cyclase (GGDEF)-like protein
MQGKPLVELELGLMGELCRLDISHYIESGQQLDVFLHPVAGSPHLDVMVPVTISRNDYIFFISFTPAFVVESLGAYQPEGHQLILTRADKPNLVEITSKGDRTKGVRSNFISPTEQQTILASKPVAGTRWILIDLPEHSLLQSFHFDWTNPYLPVFVAVLLLGSILLIYLQYLHFKTAKYAVDLETLNTELSRASLHDALTGLPNRRLFKERLRQAMHEAGRDGHRLALMLLDLNRFKEINDTLGHHVGDLLLQVVGKRVRGLLRDVDTVARMGGDEFVVLVRVDGREQAELVAAKVVSVIAREVNLGKAQLNVDACLGIALFPDHALTAEALFNCADQAMYQAKRQGRLTALYESESSDSFPDRLQLMAGLSEAVRDNQLRLWYQPKIPLRKHDDICHVEALVRWQHPTQGLLFPDAFLPLAEQANAVRPLTEWVVTEAIAAITRLQEQGTRLEIAVNLSVRVIEDVDFIAWLDAAVKASSITPASLLFEITESAEMMDSAQCRQALLQLRESGYRISVDDFGSGYSSLVMLKKFPVSELKIDRSFIINLEHDQQNQNIVKATIGLAHNLDIHVVAEGVESDATVALLKQLGCDMLQGYALQRPVPEEDLMSVCEALGERVASHA